MKIHFFRIDQELRTLGNSGSNLELLHKDERPTLGQAPNSLDKIYTSMRKRPGVSFLEAKVIEANYTSSEFVGGKYLIRLY